MAVFFLVDEKNPQQKTDSETQQHGGQPKKISLICDFVLEFCFISLF